LTGSIPTREHRTLQRARPHARCSHYAFSPWIFNDCGSRAAWASSNNRAATPLPWISLYASMSRILRAARRSSTILFVLKHHITIPPAFCRAHHHTTHLPHVRMLVVVAIRHSDQTSGYCHTRTHAPHYPTPPPPRPPAAGCTAGGTRIVHWTLRCLRSVQ